MGKNQSLLNCIFWIKNKNTLSQSKEPVDLLPLGKFTYNSRVFIFVFNRSEPYH
ncbi:hypothetical protein GARC_0573 [Paraglaciecola arctica BSs20135]|uniref:Uncharacterized protein n=1 Tax=Paraglaciecola arctica BSs20135 TaxID=493475 RepID=K6XA99_9ALTE|nr:hypothetical protein GARC_0573 [Paraglaciecola arctica BSs20135]